MGVKLLVTGEHGGAIIFVTRVSCTTRKVAPCTLLRSGLNPTADSPITLTVDQQIGFTGSDKDDPITPEAATPSPAPEVKESPVPETATPSPAPEAKRSPVPETSAPSPEAKKSSVPETEASAPATGSEEPPVETISPGG